MGANVVIELNSESRSERRQADRASRTDQPHQQARGWLPMPADPIHPDQLDGEQRFRGDLVAYLDSLPLAGELAALLGELPSRRQQPLGLGEVSDELLDRAAQWSSGSPRTATAASCRDADLPRIRLHDVRHTYATIALSNGVPLRW